MHSERDLNRLGVKPGTKVKPKIDKAKVPVVKPARALEQVDGGGYQESEHVSKKQSRVMRYLKR